MPKSGTAKHKTEEVMSQADESLQETAQQAEETVQDMSQQVGTAAQEKVREIEQKIAAAPEEAISPWLLGAAAASILGSVILYARGKKEDATFVGLWAPTFLALGVFKDMLKRP